MPSPSVTHTFANSTTADATQVNTNFTDIINGLTDGTKDLSINALTCAGAATLNGNVTLGNASSDDVTVTGSLASSIPIKTTNSYDIGSSTLGLAGIYFGANSQTVRVIGSGSMSATWTLTLPVSAGTDRYLLQTNGSGVSSWVPIRRSPQDAQNYSIATTCDSGGSSALVVTLQGADGNSASSTNPIDIVFRSATATTGTATARTVTSDLTLTVPDTATLGTKSGSTHYLYVYAIDNSGTVELAISQVLYAEGSIISTTAVDTSADSNRVIYSTTARTNVAIRFLARLTSSQTVAGTWDTAISNIVLSSTQAMKEDIIAFRAYDTSATAYGNGPTQVTFNTTSYDTHNGVSSSTYTIPRAGYYRIRSYFTGASTPGAIASIKIHAYIDSTTSYLLGWSIPFNDGNQWYTIGGDIVLSLSAAATVAIRLTTTLTGNITGTGTANESYFEVTSLT